MLLRKLLGLLSSMWNWFKREPKVIATKRQVILALYHASGMTYDAGNDLEDAELSDPNSRRSHSFEGHKIYRLWM